MIRVACQRSLIQKYKGLNCNSAGNVLNVLDVWISTQTWTDCVTRAI